VNLLPDNFPENSLPATEVHKVQWFYRRFVEDYNDEYGDGHFILAAYAAVPLFLTPDLLYKIWQNFNGYRWAGDKMSVHRIAVSDILLSPLCREIGYGLYEMHPEIRLAFLEWLNHEAKTGLGKQREIKKIKDIALFVEKYYEKSSDSGNRWGKHYADAQLLEAISYSDPLKAARQIFENLQNSKGETDMLRTMDTLIKTRQRLEKLDLKSEIDFAVFSKQADLMQAWKSLIQRNNALFLEQLNRQPQLLQLLQQTADNGITLEIEGGIVSKVEMITSRRFKVLLVGTTADDTENTNHIKSALEKRIVHEQLDLVSLTTPTASDLHGSLQALQKAGIHDDVLIYFSADQVYSSNEMATLILNEEDRISEEEIKYITDGIHSASITLILDTRGLTIPGNWMNIANPNHVCFSFNRQFVETDANNKLSVFTRAISYSINEYGVSQTNRLFFIRAMLVFNKLLPEGSLLSQPPMPYPQVTCANEAQNRFFLQGKNELVQLQQLLFANGFYDEQPSGKWDQATAKAFNSYRKEESIEEKKSKIYFIRRLESQLITKLANQKPLFLLVFSGREQRQKLSQVSERQQISRWFSQASNTFRPEVFILDDPSKEDIIEVLVSKLNRGRLKLFYYSGADKDGEFMLKDGEFKLENLALYLEYQENIHLFVSNTFRSSHVAQRIIQFGVKQAIGSEGAVSDEYAKDLGIGLFKSIVNELPVTDLPQLTDNLVFKGSDTGYTNKFSLYRRSELVDIDNWPTHWYKKGNNPPLITNTTFAVIVGVPDSKMSNRLFHCAENANSFSHVLANEKIQYSVTPKDYVTRKKAIDSLHLLRDAKDGDTCIIFYSGAVLHGYGKHATNLIDFIFSDDEIETFQTLTTYKNFVNELEATVSGKKVNICLIQDIKEIVRFNAPSQQPVWESAMSVISLSCVSAQAENRSSLQSNLFADALLKTLSNGGLTLTYKELYELLLSYMKTITDTTQQEPELTCSPPDAGYYKVFTGNPNEAAENNVGISNKPVMQEVWTKIKVESVQESEAKPGNDKFKYSVSFGDKSESIFTTIQNKKILKSLIDEISTNSKWNPDLSRTLFQLIIPGDLKKQLRSISNINWILDNYTASIPWEMLHDGSDDAIPFAVRSGMLRQFASDYFGSVKSVPTNSILVIADPNLNGFVNQLPGAAEEGRIVSRLFTKYNYKTTTDIGGRSTDIIKYLFKDSYKIVHLTGHGFYNEKDPDESGMVIGNNLFLTMKEISQMNAVPEVVFINCAWLGKIEYHDESMGSQASKLQPMSKQLVDIGVKVVVIVAYNIDDMAAMLFAEHFYGSLLSGMELGLAVKSTREITYSKYKENNTWGAYQCYGDYAYKLSDNNIETANQDAQS
jgi:hypothetical protein